MTRLGQAILALIVLAAIGFASMLTFGSGTAPAPPAAAPRAVPQPARAPGGLVVPVAGVTPAMLADTWGDARGGGTRAHQAIDIPAARGTPVIAAAPGRVEKLFDSNAGGTTLYVRSRDGKWSFYYAHLDRYAPGLREGVEVAAGTPLGTVGDSGNAGPGNTHLHFAIARMRPGERWWEGTPVNPYPLLAGKPAVR